MKKWTGISEMMRNITLLGQLGISLVAPPWLYVGGSMPMWVWAVGSISLVFSLAWAVRVCLHTKCS